MSISSSPSGLIAARKLGLGVVLTVACTHAHETRVEYSGSLSGLWRRDHALPNAAGRVPDDNALGSSAGLPFECRSECAVYGMLPGVRKRALIGCAAAVALLLYVFGSDASNRVPPHFDIQDNNHDLVHLADGAVIASGS